MQATSSAQTIRIAVALATLSAGVLSACGDDDNGGLSAEDYLEQGNAICVDVDGQIQDALPSFESEPTVEQVQQVAADLGPVLDSLRDRLAQLDPPDALQADHDNLLDEIDASVAALDEATTNDTRAEEFIETGPPIEEFSTAAVEMGLAGCS